MATKSSSTTLDTLVINKVASSAVFTDMVNNSQVNENELYLVEGDVDLTYTLSQSGSTVTLTGSDGSTSSVAVPTASSTTPKMDGTAAVGTSSAFARADHVHPTDTSRAPASHASTATTYGAGTGSNYGHVKLSDSTTSTSSTSGGIAATPAAVKAVMDAIPTATSDLTNDSGFITDAGVTSVNGSTGDVTLTYSDVGAAASSHGTHVTYSSTTPVMDGTAAVGTASTVARSDHVHPTDTSRAPTSHASTATTYGTGTASNYGHLKLSDSTSSTSSTSGGIAATPAAVKAAYDLANSKTANTGTITEVQANGTGVATSGVANIPAASTSAYGVTKLSSSTSSTSTTLAATPAAVKAVMDAIPTVPSASTTTPSMDGTASYGSGTTWARADHVHPTDTSRAPTSHATSATTYGAGTASNYGHLKLSDSTSSTSSTSGGTAATPAAVKAAYDLANGKQAAIAQGSITTTTTWSGSGPYTQTVTVSSATTTSASKVDIQPDATAIAQMIEDGVQALYVANNNGTLTMYAVGAAPSVALTLQCTVTEIG